MRKTKLAIATSTVVGLSAVASQGVLAGTASNDATANVVSDISVASVQPMQFGDLLATATDTAQMTSGGAVSGATGGVSSVGGTTQPAQFTLQTSDTAETNQTITISAVGLSQSGTTVTLPWRSLNADYNAQSASATQTTGTGFSGSDVQITGASVPTTGSTLTSYGGVEVGPNDPTGTYTGTVTVTANRE